MFHPVQLAYPHDRWCTFVLYAEWTPAEKDNKERGVLVVKVCERMAVASLLVVCDMYLGMWTIYRRTTLAPGDAQTFVNEPTLCRTSFKKERDLTHLVNSALAGVSVTLPHQHSFQTDSTFAFTMEQGVTFANNPSPQDLTNLRLFYPDPWQLVYDVLEILVVLQAAHVVHGDFKPSNLVLSPSLNRVVAIDFGGSARGVCGGGTR